MLSYVQTQKSKIYQIVKANFTFAYNVAKKCQDILHSIGLCILYMTICVALKENAKEVELKIKDLVWYNRFFIFFNNMNFYKHTQNQCLHNKKY